MEAIASRFKAIATRTKEIAGTALLSHGIWWSWTVEETLVFAAHTLLRCCGLQLSKMKFRPCFPLPQKNWGNSLLSLGELCRGVFGPLSILDDQQVQGRVAGLCGVSSVHGAFGKGAAMLWPHDVHCRHVGV